MKSKRNCQVEETKKTPFGNGMLNVLCLTPNCKILKKMKQKKSGQTNREIEHQFDIFVRQKNAEHKLYDRQ